VTPSWNTTGVYQYPSTAPPLAATGAVGSSGFRGLTCVNDGNGTADSDYELVTALQDPGDVYTISCNCHVSSGATYTANIELHFVDYVSDNLHFRSYGDIVAYNDMPQTISSGTTSCPDEILGTIVSGY